jgi:RNA polymerase sigma-70 factor, ECF subfamily
MANVSPVESIEGLAGSGPTSREREEQLVRRAQAGDAAAYEQLVHTHQRCVFGVVARIVRRREDVEDVAQEVFLKAYFSLKRFDLRSAFSTWVYKIAVNESLDYLRKKKVRPLVYEADLGDDQASNARTLEHAAGATPAPERQAEVREFLDQLLAKLPEKERMLMLLKEVEGFSVEEISEMLDLNQNTIKVRLFRARARLARFYKQRFPKSAQSRRGKH